MIKNTLFIFFLVAVQSLSMSAAFAAHCDGYVTQILDWENNSQCEALNEVGVMVPHLAYLHTTAGNGSKWVCSNSDRSDALILMAFANNMKLKVTMSSCTISNYTTPTYIIVRK